MPHGSGRAVAGAADGPAPPSGGASRGNTAHARIVPGYRLRFPYDEGSHPDFRIEWWYVTGWLERSGQAPCGFQITFFRTRPDLDARNPSAFAAREIMIAHAALSIESQGRLIHDQRIARSAFALAGAKEGRTHVWLDDWSLVQNGATYRARIPARAFLFDLTLQQTQPPLLQGNDGLSRKGPRAESASYYYSIPHLEVSGTVGESRREAAVRGAAWLDHEWSSSYMDERAVGWDWIGINFADGGALMAFRMRDPGGRAFWAGGAYRAADGARRAFSPREVEFTPLRTWQSPRTGATYPVSWLVRAGTVEIAIEPLMDDQESDTRASVGAVYWEGAVLALRDGKPAGRGYLELTGYHQPLRF